MDQGFDREEWEDEVESRTSSQLLAEVQALSPFGVVQFACCSRTSEGVHGPAQMRQASKKSALACSAAPIRVLCLGTSVAPAHRSMCAFCFRAPGKSLVLGGPLPWTLGLRTGPQAPIVGGCPTRVLWALPCRCTPPRPTASKGTWAGKRRHSNWRWLRGESLHERTPTPPAGGFGC